MSARRHVAALDGLRALAVIAVVMHHARHAAPAGLAARAWNAVAQGGWIGVDVFFVLSGFLITDILLAARPHPRFFRTFYARRTLRIFPPYYAVLVAMLVVAPHVFDAGTPEVQRVLHHQLPLWTYTSNLAVVADGGWLYTAGWLHLTHLWSLAIEEQFYLVWPLVVYVAPRRGVALVAVVLVGAAPIVRGAMLAADASPHAIYAFTLARIDTLAIGALLAIGGRVAPARMARLAPWALAIGGAAMATLAVTTGGFDADTPAIQLVGFTAVALFAAGLVHAAATAPATSRLARVLGWRPLVAIGAVSYGLYLYQGLLVPFAARALGGGVTMAVGLLAGSLAAAAVSWWVLERPLRALKDRWAPSVQ